METSESVASIPCECEIRSMDFHPRANIVAVGSKDLDEGVVRLFALRQD